MVAHDELLLLLLVISDLLGNSTSHLSHGDHTARQRHKHSQPRKARAGALMAHHPAWVGHYTGGSRSTPTVHPCPLPVGRLWVAQQHYPHQNGNNMVAERQCWLLSSKSVQPACATVSMLVVMRRMKTRPRLKHTAKPMRILRSISAENG